MFIKIPKSRKIIISTLFILFITIAAICCIGFTYADNAEKIISLNKTFNVKIPDYFTYDYAEYALSDEITQHYILNGIGEYSCLSGFIQVRKQMLPLHEYIKQSEENFSAAVYDYEKKPMLQTGNIGFEISFKIRGTESDTQVMQSICQRDNSFFIVSLSAPIKNDNPEILKTAFDEIKNSVTISEDSLPSGKLTEYYIQSI